MNNVTGRIDVRKCETPGSGNCIDYEQQQTYFLTFIARDFEGTGQTVSVPLVINVLDENDNAPVFTAQEYVGYITEGDTVPSPPIQVSVRHHISYLRVAFH